MDKVHVVEGDATKVTGDVLVLKYAQNFFGVDAAVAHLLAEGNPLVNMRPAPGRHVIVPTEGRLGVTFVVFVGVVRLPDLDYGQIRSFSKLALKILASALPDARRIILTVHGPGYGLDEKEAFLALTAGIRDAFIEGSYPRQLTHLLILERNQGRAQRLSQAFTDFKAALAIPRGATLSDTESRMLDVGVASSQKPHVFVAMPFAKGKMEDVYGFGIQGAVNAAGYLCERIDFTTFTGDVLDRIRDRIESASLVIADLTGANANVYLEVGYAWGRGKQTVLLAEEDTDLKFDVRGQRCLLYSNITDLAKKLAETLNGLQPPR